MRCSKVPGPRPSPRPSVGVLSAVLLAVVAGCSEDDPGAAQGGDGGSSIVDVSGNGGSSGSSAGNGGGAGAFATSPPLRDPVMLADADLAQEALGLLGSSAVGGNGPCKNCHSLGRPTLTRWAKLTQDFADACLDQPDFEDQADVDAMFSCFQEQAGDGEPFAPENFGIYAAAASLPWFSFLFEHASEVDNATREKQGFVTRVGMPRAGTAWTQDEFDVVAEWFARRLPNMLELVPADSGEECTPGLDPRVAEHVAALATTGWRAKNASVPLLMFGCADGQSGSACLGGFPLAQTEANAEDWVSLPGSQLRLLHDNSNAPTTYWSRCSADGRYIASGLRDFDDEDRAGQIVDLDQERVIPSNFSYDATFFPDNSGFLVQQGGGAESGSDAVPSDGSVDAGETAMLCQQSVLASEPTVLTGEEPECNQLSGRFGLYQQLATSLDGSDYWVIHGSYESDDGGFAPVLTNPSAAYEADSSVTFTPMVNQGNGYSASPSVRIELSRQGDPMLSPSGRLLVTRLKGREFTTDADGFDLIAAEQSGYALYTVDTSGAAPALADVGRICVQGGKATFSFDERWMVFHHYVVDSDAVDLGFSSANAAGFADYQELGSSNLYLVDLLTGESRRLTNMPAGQYALFPHFRSDGWIYFVVRTLENDEYFVATDAALVVENGG
jgi:hypothetical protein